MTHEYRYAIIERTEDGTKVVEESTDDPSTRCRRHGHGLLSLLHDLDRCEHGRHEGDVCSSCGGPSHGNPLLPENRIIGYTLGALPIRVPAPGERWGEPDKQRDAT